MKCQAWLAGLGALLLGCTERIQEGGFETADLQAFVQRPDGSPVPAARVWLVRSRGDAAPAAVIDSALTDTAGTAKFLFAKDADLSAIGLDAQSGDSLGLAPSVFKNGTSAVVAIQETKTVQIGKDSTGALLGLHVPGSHFASKVSENGTASVLALPKGTWDLAMVAGTRILVVRALPVRADTVLAGVAGVKSGATDSAPEAVDTLRDGPDIALDSFRVDGVAQYADNSLPPAWKWTSTGEGDESLWHSDSTYVTEDTGWTVLASRPFSRISLVPPDTQQLQGFASVKTPTLPEAGTLALEFAFPVQLAADTNLVRRIQFLDTLGHGVEVFLQHSTSSLDSFGLAGYLATTIQKVPSNNDSLLKASIWYFSWTSDSIAVRDEDGIVGTARLQSGSFATLRLYLLVRTKHPTGSTSATLSRSRLYKPR